VLLLAGVALFIAVLVSAGVPGIVRALAPAGWGLVPVALYHWVPLLLDAAAIRVLFKQGGGSLRQAVLARWVGESANSLMPAGQIGGPLLMARQLTLQGADVHDAAAAIIVSTTLQTVAQIVFALLGVSLLGALAGHPSDPALSTAALIASGVLAVQVAGFYLLQRRGLFSRVMRAGVRLAGKRDWSRWVSHAESLDGAVEATYGRLGPVTLSFLLSLIGWLVGTVEVFLILLLLNHPVGWLTALVLESLGQAIRAAAFAVPGALGVQEGGYLLLAPLAGLPPDTALALSLAKRAREIIMGVPGLILLRRSKAAN
jgi:putative membrane protein